MEIETMDYMTDDWPAAPPLAALVNRVHNVSALTLLAALPDGCVDAVITDPPYGFGLDVWDKFDAIQPFTDACHRVMKDDSFFAFTILAPYDIEWRLALAKSGFKFVDHVVWLKRNTGAYSAGLCHAHESLFIYRKGTPRYFAVKGKYTDVKVPGLLFDAITIESIQRQIAHLQLDVKRGHATTMKASSSHSAHTRRTMKNSTRSPEYANFTTVWSFLPHNNTNRNGSKLHASIKPLPMFERLVGLLSDDNALIIDPFAGSGTTAIAARNLGRRFIVGDITPEYVQVAKDRLAAPYTPNMFITTELATA